MPQDRAQCANCQRSLPADRKGSWYCSRTCEREAEYDNEMMQIALMLKYEYAETTVLMFPRPEVH